MINMDKPKDIELRSEKIKNIIGQIPPFLIRYGNSVLSVILLLLIFLATSVPFPHRTNVNIHFQVLNNGEDSSVFALLFVPTRMISSIPKAVSMHFSLDVYPNNLFVPTTIDSISQDKKIINQTLYQKVFIKIENNVFQDKPEIKQESSLLKGELTLKLPPQTFIERFYK